MNELESQIAKIQLGNKKTANSYVHVMAEKATVGMAELYLVAELPLLNPAAEESCERITTAIASTLKRAYKRPEQENSFENAIASINDELAKLTSLGQTQWVNKLNCVLAVKSGSVFHIASCGKVSAFLLRNEEFTDISCSPAKNHPLKTFENYASGKIKLGDLLILSTTQLFNYLSMDRLLNIVSNSDFLTATKTIIEMLKATADPQVAFGVLLNLQVPLGQTIEEDDELENYIVENPDQKRNFLGLAYSYIKTAFTTSKHQARTPKVGIPKISLGERFENLRGGTKNIMSKSKGWMMLATNSAKNISKNVTASNIKSLSKQKKIFLASVIVLAIVVVANIFIALRVKKTTVNTAQVTQTLTDVQNLLLSAQGSILYKDENTAINFFKQAKDKFPEEKNISKENQELYNKVNSEFQKTQNQLDKVYEPEVTNLGSIGQSNNLINLPNYIGTQVNESIVSYNKDNGKIEDSVLKLPISSLKISYLGNNLAGVYDGNNLYTWNYTNGNLSPGFNQIVPTKDEWAGLASYPTNSRIYLVDKKTSTIISFLTGSSGISKPTVSVRDSKLAEAIDLTIDGSIYVLTANNVYKYQSGDPAEFNLNITQSLSGNGKIYTQKDFNNLYILDPGNNRILVLTKKGELVNSIKSSQFTAIKDFSVDEKNKTIYVLNDATLLKVSLP